MSHTPAPWEWDGDVCNYNKEQEAPWLIGGPDMDKILGGEITCRNPADRDLIAAAPELLEALKYARRYMRVNDHDIGYIDKTIAKAEGKS